MKERIFLRFFGFPVGWHRRHIIYIFFTEFLSVSDVCLLYSISIGIQYTYLSSVLSMTSVQYFSFADRNSCRTNVSTTTGRTTTLTLWKYWILGGEVREETYPRPRHGLRESAGCVVILFTSWTPSTDSSTTSEWSPKPKSAATSTLITTRKASIGDIPNFCSEL